VPFRAPSYFFAVLPVRPPARTFEAYIFNYMGKPEYSPMKFVLPILLSAGLCILSCSEEPVPTPEEPLPEDVNLPEPGPHIQQQVRQPIGRTISGFYEALPASYFMYNKKYPLLIFITGAGERGNGSEEELKEVLQPYGPAKLLNAGSFPKDFLIDDRYYSFIVLSVQMTTNTRATPEDIDNLISYALANYRIDESRIYMTGLSLGGGCVWDYAVHNLQYAQKLAAITPMAGKSISPSKEKAKVIADAQLPVWAFHSEFDTAVPSIYTKNYVKWINEFSPGQARMTLFPDSTHICWKYSYNPTYQESDSINVYEWMLMQKRE